MTAATRAPLDGHVPPGIGSSSLVRPVPGGAAAAFVAARQGEMSR